MTSYFRPAATLLLLMTIITGGFYPALVTLLAQTVYPAQANGSLIRDKQGQTIGSALIGQGFSQARYFWGRPSATAPSPYNAAASGGSNLGPTNPALRDAVTQRIQALQQLDSGNHAPVPVDLVTASASGLDPHISIAAALYQIKRVAKARKLEESAVRDLIESHIEPRQWRVFGEPRVNVLALNLALDAYAQTTQP
ncbi:MULTISPECIES: potassium-transporting ATPase subunit KdpC [Methylomonas]|uniref:Potassium-transporting ATPase KdpC subunit n=2 Tax=Methylomonas TaxID=416 RepID=A0A140E421_9GAMM|nr:MULTISPECIES: potassium-transporting ATPase subunit KdpC [Methylomonas]AMK75145.1 potassium-transporting ATPase subunit C [Methylomonas denitrificans]OAH99455.1 potassium-transporting ATPase subunit C [Methylomonas methanica]TCV85108.1 K+-transporting ATPase ATPase C chain [Methylomonas methanica]